MKVPMEDVIQFVEDPSTCLAIRLIPDIIERKGKGIGSAFIWTTSPQGGAYWYGLAKNLHLNKPLPQDATDFLENILVVSAMIK